METSMDKIRAKIYGEILNTLVQDKGTDYNEKAENLANLFMGLLYKAGNDIGNKISGDFLSILQDLGVQV